ncbi:hypothetical protein HMPREF1219_02140 [Corynebacterium pyruviciproducens ATCC BAA-1742]|uniref:Uncharacterized protein n=2 Tax=Corynebacterium pyruviciproducens TaxID=598660 RepID=S2ZCQ8_9CORY|nr:hypothetical protein HMPREF1219_02140 [Corynebacterium pyruviciproducens ATCC BAA-1742]
MEITIKAKQFVFLLPNNPPKKGTPMKGFKKASIASVTAIAVAAGMCTPAFAEEAKAESGVKITDNVCTITIPKAEADLLGITTTPLTVKVSDAQSKLDELLAAYKADAEKQTPADKDKKADKKEGAARAADGKTDTPKTDWKAKSTTYASVASAYRSCAAGKEQSEVDYDLAGIFSSPAGEPNETSLGLIICGSVLTALGLIAALLPQLKSLLPAEIAAMLP